MTTQWLKKETLNIFEVPIAAIKPVLTFQERQRQLSSWGVEAQRWRWLTKFMAIKSSSPQSCKELCFIFRPFPKKRSQESDSESRWFHECDFITKLWFLYEFYGISIGFLWDFYRISIGFLWDSYGISTFWCRCRSTVKAWINWLSPRRMAAESVTPRPLVLARRMASHFHGNIQNTHILYIYVYINKYSDIYIYIYTLYIYTLYTNIVIYIYCIYTLYTLICIHIIYIHTNQLKPLVCSEI